MIHNTQDAIDHLLTDLQNPQDGVHRKKILNDAMGHINLFLKSASRDAVETLVQRIEQNNASNDSRSANLLSSYVMSRTGKDAEAAEKLLEIIKTDPEQPPPFYMSLAKNLLNLGQLDEAEAFYSRIEAAEPAGSLVGLGRVACKRQQYDKATALFEKALDKQPDNIVAINGLIQIAADQRQNWKSALGYVQQGLIHHPDNLKFAVLKARCLVALNQFEMATMFLEEMVAAHPRHLPFHMIRIECYRQQFDFRTAEQYIGQVRSYEPSNIELAVLQAENLYDLGRLSDIPPVLDEVQFADTKLRSRFEKRINELRVRVLTCKNALAALSDEPETMVDASRVVSDALVRHFVNKADFDEALSRLSGQLDNTPRSIGDLSDQILTLFNMQRVRNIMEYAAGKTISYKHKKRVKAGVFHTLGFSDILSWLDRHDHICPHENWRAAFALLAFIQAKYRHTYFNTYESPDQTALITHKIKTHIRKKQPLSLVRLGDFEGMYLGYGKKQKSFETDDRLEAQRVYWGRPQFTMAEWNTHLKDDYHAAIRNADIIGIPGPHRLCRELHAFSRPHWIIRGIVAALENVLSNRLHPTREAAGHWIVSAHVHQHLDSWGGYEFIFKALKKCSVISCHTGIVAALEKRYGLEVKKNYTVEPEFKHAQKFGCGPTSSRHYPNQYQYMVKAVSMIEPGEVFLVGAGLLGKIYCDIIRRHGGIAIDVGSMMDVWTGHKTRVCVDFSEHYDYGTAFDKLKKYLPE